MNKGIIIGRATKGPELKTSTSGVAYSTISIASNINKDETLFLDISTFKETAKTCAEYVKKGDLLAIEYTTRNNKYTDNNGIIHHGFSFMAQRVYFLSKAEKQQNNDKITAKEQQKEDLYEEFSQNLDLTDADLPF